MNLIGISGTNGSGKDSLGQMLAERHGWMTVSVSDFLREEAKKRGLPIEREVLRTISAQWRRESGLGVLVDKAVEVFKKNGNKYAGLEIGPLRNPGEADRLKELGGVLVWTDGDPKVRYERIKVRKRSAEDDKTFEQFLAEEQAEIQHSGDKATLSLAGVKERADIFLINNGNDPEKFKDQAEKAIRSSKII